MNNKIDNLQKMFATLGCKHYENKKTQELSKKGGVAYGNLTNILDYLKDQGLIEYNIDKLDTYVTEVIKLGY